MADDPILGTSGSDVLRVETAVTFDWLPNPGFSYFEDDNLWIVGPTYSWWYAVVWSGPSTAHGSVTFQNVASSAAFGSAPSGLDFTFSNGQTVGLDKLGASGGWTWDPITGLLDPHGAGGGSGERAGAFFSTDLSSDSTLNDGGSRSDSDFGHWVLAPEIHDVDVFGGAGNDTIYAGQGNETLSGDEGDDTIYAGRGVQIVLGGDGNDAIHGGTGWQTLDGGDGNDTIWAGAGSQIVMGDAGNDLIYGGLRGDPLLGGAGADTLWGGTGNDTIWAGINASQFLDGGTGNDVLYAGFGDDTLTGGAGRDVFAFYGALNGHAVITDFRVGQDVLQVTRGIDDLAVTRPADLVHRLSSSARGEAVLDLGFGGTVTFSGVSAAQLAPHPATVFRVV